MTFKQILARTTSMGDMMKNYYVVSSGVEYEIKATASSHTSRSGYRIVVQELGTKGLSAWYDASDFTYEPKSVVY